MTLITWSVLIKWWLFQVWSIKPLFLDNNADLESGSNMLCIGSVYQYLSAVKNLWEG